MSRITISTSNGFLDFMKVKVAARHLSYKTLFYSVLLLAFLLPFVFIFTAVITLDDFEDCTSLDCLGRRLGPRLLRRANASPRMAKELFGVLLQANNKALPEGMVVPESFDDLVAEMRAHQYDSMTFALKLKAMLFPKLHKVVFLDDDIVIQRDLSPLWDINLQGKVNGAVETCRGNDPWVMSKRFKTYFNFSHPLIAQNFDPEQCPWAYGMNIFDLQAWRKTNIRETYHYWLKENLSSNLTLWRFGTLPPALIAFRGHVHPIDPSWHMLGLGYQFDTDLANVQKAAVIHYNGLAKPWLDIAFPALRPFWTRYVNYSNDFIRNCNIMES